MRKPLILIVDDDPDIVECLTEILQESGRYNTLSARDGIEALAILDQHKGWGGLAKNKINGILLDIKMPVLDGLGFLKRWRDSEFFLDEMPIVLLTAYENNDIWGNISVSDRGGVSAYLKKPVHSRHVLDVVEKCVVRREHDYMRDTLRDKGREKLGFNSK